MLRIYPVCLQLNRQVRPLAQRIARFDRDYARQLRRSSLSITLNVAEGSGVRGGNRRLRYETALGSARETLANLEASCAIGYLVSVPHQTRASLDHIIGTLVALVR